MDRRLGSLFGVATRLIPSARFGGWGFDWLVLVIDDVRNFVRCYTDRVCLITAVSSVGTFIGS